MPFEGESFLSVVAGLFVAWGLLNCFCGYRLFRMVVGGLGFLLGALVGGGIISSSGAPQWVAVLGALAAGLVGCRIALAFIVIGFFFIGGTLGALLGVVIGHFAGGQTSEVLSVVLSLVLGVIAVAYRKPMIIVSTAFEGAGLALASAAILFGSTAVAQPSDLEQLQTHGILGLLAWVGLGIAGTLVQFRLFGERPLDERAYRRA